VVGLVLCVLVVLREQRVQERAKGAEGYRERLLQPVPTPRVTA
jgi:hypothetical protein